MRYKRYNIPNVTSSVLFDEKYIIFGTSYGKLYQIDFENKEIIHQTKVIKPYPIIKIIAYDKRYIIIQFEKRPYIMIFNVYKRHKHSIIYFNQKITDIIKNHKNEVSVQIKNKLYVITIPLFSNPYGIVDNNMYIMPYINIPYRISNPPEFIGKNLKVSAWNNTSYSKGEYVKNIKTVTIDIKPENIICIPPMLFSHKNILFTLSKCWFHDEDIKQLYTTPTGYIVQYLNSIYYVSSIHNRKFKLSCDRKLIIKHILVPSCNHIIIYYTNGTFHIVDIYKKRFYKLKYCILNIEKLYMIHKHMICIKNSEILIIKYPYKMYGTYYMSYDQFDEKYNVTHNLYNYDKVIEPILKNPNGNNNGRLNLPPDVLYYIRKFL
jgi:sporulation protein YlmC with PRC-barrel domain